MTVMRCVTIIMEIDSLSLGKLSHDKSGFEPFNSSICAYIEKVIRKASCNK